MIDSHDCLNYNDGIDVDLDQIVDRSRSAFPANMHFL